MGPRLRGDDELGERAYVAYVLGLFVSYRQASYLGSARSPEKNPMQKCLGFFFVWGIVLFAGSSWRVMGPRLRGDDELGERAYVAYVRGLFVSYRQASYLGSARRPEKNPMQRCLGFFFVW